jgi:transposase
VQAAIVTLTARHRVARRGMGELARDLFGVTVSTGAVDAICQRASDPLAGPRCQLQDWVLDQDTVHVDETGWRTRGEGRALWTTTTPRQRSCRSPNIATASSSTHLWASTAPGSSSRSLERV